MLLKHLNVCGRRRRRRLKPNCCIKVGRTVWALAKADKLLITRTQRVSNNTTTFVMSSSITPPGSLFRPRMELHHAPTAYLQCHFSTNLHGNNPPADFVTCDSYNYLFRFIFRSRQRLTSLYQGTV